LGSWALGLLGSWALGLVFDQYRRMSPMSLSGSVEAKRPLDDIKNGGHGLDKRLSDIYLPDSA